MDNFFATEDGKRFARWATWAVAALTVFLGIEALIAVKDWRSAPPSYNSISVTGEATVSLVPDIATFSFAVSADGKTASEAQSVVTPKMNAVLAALKELGVEEKDINTSDYSVWPKYKYENVVCSTGYCPPSRQVEDGYTATHNVTVKIRNREMASQAIGVVGTKGATNISNVTFTVDDPSAAIMKARKEAIDDAKEQAKELAKSLDVRLVRVVGFYDEGRGYPVAYDTYNKEMSSAAGAVAPTLPIGEQESDVRVTVMYEIR